MTTTFSVTRDDIIKAALRKLGALAQGESPTTDQITEASFSLNTMVKAWEADGMPLWALRTIGLTFTYNINSYTLGPDYSNMVQMDKPLKIIQAWNRNEIGLDIPMRSLTKQEYAILGNKYTTGTPIQYYYDPGVNSGTLYVFPSPDLNAEANQSIFITYQKPFADFNVATDVPDFPQEWYNAVIYGLALTLAPEYGIPAESRVLLGKEAEAARQLALSFGTEEGSIYFQRETRGW